MTLLGLSRRGTQALLAMLVAGLAIRVWFAWHFYGVQYDIRSFEIVADALRSGHTGVYESVRWPYPGGYLPFVALADWGHRHLGIKFDGLVQLPSILADLGIAVLVPIALRRRGASERMMLAGAGLVALGPSFIAVSGYHGQIDSAGALPALAGAMVWTQRGRRRGVWSGLLIGLGAAVKQPLGFAALALMPTARSWRERITVLVLTAAVPIVSLIPFLASTPHGVIDRMRQNSGVPGFGGLSTLVQPDLTQYYATLHGPIPSATNATLDLVDAQRTIVLIGVLLAAGLAWRARLPALQAASLIYLTVFVVNPNFGYPYLIWGLPFFIAAGYVREVALFQVAILPATLWFYWRPFALGDGWTYIVMVQLVWVGLIAALAYAVVNLLRAQRSRTRRAGTPA